MGTRVRPGGGGRRNTTLVTTQQAVTFVKRVPGPQGYNLAVHGRGVAPRLLLVLTFLAACGEVEDGFEYQGMAGQRVDAVFEAFVPLIELRQAGDTTPHRFLVDTGAPFTLFDRDSFPALGQDGLHTLDVEAFGLSFPSYPVISYDLFPVNPDDPSAPSGIVGGDLLRHFALSLDYHGAQVWLSDPFDPDANQDLPVGSRASLPMIVRGGGYSGVPGDCAPKPSCGVVEVPATRILMQAVLEAETAPVWVLVDSGASSVVLDDDYFATLDAASEGRPRLLGQRVLTVEGYVTAFQSRLWRMTLRGASGDASSQEAATLENVPVMVIPGSTLLHSLSVEVHRPVQALVGGTLLRHFLTTIDYPAETLHLSPYQDKSHIPPNEFVGVGFTLESVGLDWQVLDVFAGTDAATQGLAPGQVVTKIGDVSIVGKPVSAVEAEFAKYKLGEKMPVSVRVSGELQLREVLVENLLPDYLPK
jgi:hypothetical protein